MKSTKSRQTLIESLPERVIIFDGVCNFCNGSVKFIIKRDPQNHFAFTPAQSQVAKDLIALHQNNFPGVRLGVDTFFLIKTERSYIYSDAAIEIASELTGFWPLLKILKFVPRPIRDFFYRLFARHRYKLFGKMDLCNVPTADIRSRFIGL